VSEKMKREIDREKRETWCWCEAEVVG